ncbi:hypothetical protein, variant [Aphanomyces invadans]|uniref:Endonuclease/exonuclease/phosphatase domain-containing protein n=1 Tax=Aphanomyces invadans TaxID=157072 RepID=A0A024UQB6_9STRA|nr:hypothetical protein, variant [Aphanomyces invadans]ETW08464.1 hypothetical protein, variant [Aphanomyces invadans]|eukprot:XP_008862269.1 hypothetical protein, variant [Aphanomyces invadans]
MLTVCTYNIRFILDRWPERKPLVEHELRRAKADLYALQEVNIGGHNFGQHIQLPATALPANESYETFEAPAARRYFETLPLLGWLFTTSNPLAAWAYDFCAWFNERFLASILGGHVQWLYYHPILQIVTFLGLGTAWVFGTTVYARKSIAPKHHTQLLIGGWKVAQRVVVTVDGVDIHVVNVHLASDRDEERFRVEQVRTIADWIAATTSGTNVIIMGDFNCEPNKACYLYLKQRGFTSAHMQVHGVEPDVTFHQGLEAPTKDVGTEVCLDYIFYKGQVPWRVCDPE